MKKMYESPVAEKVDFEYEDNVVASGVVTTNQDTKYGNSCKQEHSCDWGYGGGWGWSWTFLWPRVWGGSC